MYNIMPRIKAIIIHVLKKTPKSRAKQREQAVKAERHRKENCHQSEFFKEFWPFTDPRWSF